MKWFNDYLAPLSLHAVPIVQTIVRCCTYCVYIIRSNSRFIFNAPVPLFSFLAIKKRCSDLEDDVIWWIFVNFFSVPPIIRPGVWARSIAAPLSFGLHQSLEVTGPVSGYIEIKTIQFLTVEILFTNKSGGRYLIVCC